MISALVRAYRARLGGDRFVAAPRRWIELERARFFELPDETLSAPFAYD